MSNQVKLTLRPPPNIDFVHGYPGIPPGSTDRPQAAVKGDVEVRVGPGGVKAKWVRIELRKVETLPGAGPTATFYDFVGPSPINLWQAGDDEYGMLQGANYAFSIRIPESIPPSISLENRAGVKYELVASVCVKGKKNFLRSRKSTVVSHIAPIIIDKHELHSTWPVYCQYDSREVEQEGVTLLVERSNTCFGPGDRVSVTATVKSQSIHTVILRGFEFSLKELTIFRAGTHATGKKNAPHAKTTIVDETKLPVNATLYGGTQHKSELACNISPRHTTTSLGAARHIDITYTLNVIAFLGSGQQITMELPVIISNWQRSVSTEAVKRIGPAPSLSLTPVGAPAPSTTASSSAAQTFSGRPAQADYGLSDDYHSLPNSAGNSRTPASGMLSDEFGQNYGYGKPEKTSPLAAEFGPSSSSGKPQQSSVARTNLYQVDEFASAAGSRPPTSTGTGGRRPRSSRSDGGQNTNRFTITNALESEIPVVPQSKPATSNKWMTSEEEKQKLYETARARVDKVQGAAARGEPIPTSNSPDSNSNTNSNSKPASGSKWMTAEEEKAKLYAKATARRDQVQNLAEATSDPNLNASYATGSSQAGEAITPAAALYSDAMASRSHATPSGANHSPPPPRQSPSQPSRSAAYPSAEEEKAALRYKEAKMAVERTQGRVSPPPAAVNMPSPASQGSGPIPYDSLYSPQPQMANGPIDQPPSFAASTNGVGGFNPALSEKERVRLAFEARDAASAASGSSPPNDAPAYSPPPPASSGSPRSKPIVGQEILSEKERLRRKYEEEDARAMASRNGAGSSSGSSPQPPPRTDRATPGSRPKPTPPLFPGGSSPSKVMSAAEEKELLRARYAAADQPSSSAPPNGVNGIPGAPPPLMPRPPAEYINETREEDIRVSRYISDDNHPPANFGDASGHLQNGMNGSANGYIPPPLPPKPPGNL